MSDSTHTMYRIFQWMYWIGIPLAFLIMLGHAPPGSALGAFLPFSFNVEGGGQGGWLLLISYSHVFVLSGAGFLVRREGPPSRYVHAGTLVQTAGYLHTLIGFGAALFLLNPDNLDVLAVLGPIGSALGTSILGWFLGGEIVGRTEDDLTGDAAEHLSTLLEQVESFTELATEKHCAYLEAIEEGAMAQRRINDAQRDAMQAAADVGQSINGELASVESSLSGVQASVKALRTHVEALDAALSSTLASEDFQTQLDGLACATGRANDSLTNAADASETIKNALEAATVNAQNARDALEDLANGAASEHEAYAKAVRQARTSIMEIAKTFREVLDRTAESAEALKNTPTNLDPVAESLKELQQMLRALTEEIDEVTEAVRGVGESGRETKTAIEETGVSARRMTKAVRQTRTVIDDMIDEVLRNDLEDRVDGMRSRTRSRGDAS